MRKLAAVFFVALIATVSHAKGLEARHIAGRVQPQVIAGSYTGPSEAYGLVLEVDPSGALRGNYVEMGSVAVLNQIVVNGSNFTAHASFDDGTLRMISGSLVRRSGGGGAVGLRIHAVPVEDVGLVDTFFEKL